MACSSYKEFTLNNCPDAFIIKTLAASTDFIWQFTGKFGQVYKGAGASDPDGKLTITVGGENDVLTQDLFQHFSGAWELRLFTFGTGGIQVPVVFCSMYDFLVILFSKVTPMPEPNNVMVDLGCE